MTDPTITIAGLRAERDSLIEALEDAIRSESAYRLASDKATAHNAAVNAGLTAERDALAAQLAEVRAELAAAPKVCAIHSYEHGPGPCMTCGAWPPGTRELIAACQTRIAGLEQVADERGAEVARLAARVAELEARPVLDASRLAWALLEVQRDGRTLADIASDTMAQLGPVTLTAQDSLGAPPTSPTVSPPDVFAGVSLDELACAWFNAGADDSDKNRYVPHNMRDFDRERAAAVVARLKATLVAPVDPEVLLNKYYGSGPSRDGSDRELIADMRAALIAAGVPVTPERDR